VEIITFGVFSSMNIVDKGNMASSPTILTLENSGIYVGVPNGSKMSSNIEWPVNESFCFYPTLSIPNIYLDYSYVWLRRYIDNMWFRYEIYVVEYMHQLNDVFHYS